MQRQREPKSLYVAVQLNKSPNLHDTFRITGTNTDFNLFLSRVKEALDPFSPPRRGDCIRDRRGALLLDASGISDGELLFYCPGGERLKLYAPQGEEISPRHDRKKRHRTSNVVQPQPQPANYPLPQPQQAVVYHPASAPATGGFFFTEPWQVAQPVLSQPVLAQPAFSPPQGEPTTVVAPNLTGPFVPHENVGLALPPDVQEYEEDEEDKKPDVQWEACLLGILIGDAFGAAFSFASREWVQENIKDFTTFQNHRTGEWALNFTPGKYTDKGEMTIGTIKALIAEARSLDTDRLLDWWKKEYEENKKRYGFGRQGHGGVRFYFEGDSPNHVTIADMLEKNAQKKYPGNAPAMRAIPIGFLGYDIPKYAIMNADATHPHPKARAASFLIAKATDYLIVKQRRKSRVLDYCLTKYKKVKKRAMTSMDDEETMNHLLQVSKLDDYHDVDENEKEEKYSKMNYELLCGPQPIPESGKTGMPCDAMRTAAAVLYLVKYSRGPLDVLKAAVSLGGDTDTMASLCLGLVAGREGLKDIPSTLIDNVEDRAAVHDLVESWKEFVINWG